MIHSAFCALLVSLLLTGPVRAQSSSPQSCSGLEAFVGIVDLTNILLKDDLSNYPNHIRVLAYNLGRINQSAVLNRLRAAGHASSQSDARYYLGELAQFINAQRTNGQAFGGWILNTRAFRAKHASMQVLADTLCTDDSTPEERKLGKGETATTSLKLAQIKLNRGLANFSIDKEAWMLMQVFLMLGVSLATLFALNYARKLMHAIRLDRYACAIPAALTTRGHEITGHINILGNRGLSFEVFDRSDPINEHALTLGVQVKFQTETAEFKAILTKPYDGSAGFRLTVPIKKPAIQELLKHSQIKPHRKLEINRHSKKKKPAQPSQGALALKSRRSPAE